MKHSEWEEVWQDILIVFLIWLFTEQKPEFAMDR